MSLKTIRKKRGLTQRELARQSGVNLRSLQDYEQGHKQLSSAGGDVLLRLSMVLACSVEDLLLGELVDKQGAPYLAENRMSPEEIDGISFICAPYSAAGKWVCGEKAVAIVFYYEGERHLIPFNAVFVPEYLDLLKGGAELLMEGAIEDILFERAAEAL